jgi:hypothetical protein
VQRRPVPHSRIGPVLRPRSRLVLPVLRPAGCLVPPRTVRDGIAANATPTTPYTAGQQDQTASVRRTRVLHMRADSRRSWAASPAATGQDNGGTGTRSAPRWSGSSNSASGYAEATGRTAQDTQTATRDTAKTATATSGTAGKHAGQERSTTMSQSQPDPDPDDLEQFGQPIYHGDGLQVRGLTEEELARFLAAHAGQPARLVGGGWNHLEPAPTPPSSPAGPLAVAGPTRGSYGDPGASALAVHRRLRAAELADWSRSLAWRLPLVGGAGIITMMVTSPFPGVARLIASLVVGAVVGWRLRFRATAEASAWRKGARGERRTARRLRRLQRRGYVVFHDLAMPGSRANIDHLVIGPTGVFVIDSKQYSGRIQQTPDGRVWHNHYPMDEQFATVRAEARSVEAILGAPVIPLLCVHGASVQWGGLAAQGVAIVPAGQLGGALGADVVLSAEQVAVLAGTAQARLHPARLPAKHAWRAETAPGDAAAVG